MVAAIKFRRYMTGIGVFCVVVSEFSHREKSSSVILLIIDKGIEVDFYDTVFPFCLTISLGIKGR